MFSLQSAISFSEPSKLLLSAFGRCESGPTLGVEKQFDSLTSVQIKWSANESNLVQVVEDTSRLESHNGNSLLPLPGKYIIKRKKKS